MYLPVPVCSIVILLLIVCCLQCSIETPRQVTLRLGLGFSHCSKDFVDFTMGFEFCVGNENCSKNNNTSAFCSQKSLTWMNFGSFC